MRRMILFASLVGGVACVVLVATASGTVAPDPTGSVPAGDPAQSSTPLAYLTGVLLLVGGAAVFWLPVVAAVLLGVAAIVGMAVGVTGGSQDQFMFGILALILAGVTVVSVIREGRSARPISQPESKGASKTTPPAVT